jgi:hypothetical protein
MTLWVLTLYSVDDRMINVYGAAGGTVTDGINWSTRRKSVPMPLCPPQIPHDQNWEWTQVTMLGSQQLSARAVAWPIFGCDTVQFGRSLLTLTLTFRHTACRLLDLFFRSEDRGSMFLGHISISTRIHGFRTPEDISFHSYHCDDLKYRNWHNVHMTFWLGIASWISSWSAQ